MSEKERINSKEKTSSQQERQFVEVMIWGGLCILFWFVVVILGGGFQDILLIIGIMCTVIALLGLIDIHRERTKVKQ